MNVSLIHHWLVSMRGGEKVLEQFCRLMPSADIHTLVYDETPEAVSELIKEHSIHATALNILPGAHRYYKSLLPLFPAAIRNHNIKSDFILSSDASLVKGMHNGEEAPHVCYCHSPPRYLWDIQEEYLESMNGLSRTIFKMVTPYLRNFDRKSAKKVDHFIANSRFVQERIQRIYGRDSEVIHPPVDLAGFYPMEDAGDYYLVVSALVPYKRIDLAIEAFNRLGKKLVVIGTGSEQQRLSAKAGKNIRLLGAQSDEALKTWYAGCRAFVFPGVEDFGITPLEAQASGRPVIAYRKGGGLETVREGETGMFFDDQTVDSLVDAIRTFEKNPDQFSPEACRKNAERFGEERFREEIKDFLMSRYPSYFSDFNWGA